LHRASQEVAAEETLRFQVTRLNRPLPAGVEWISAPAVYNDAAILSGHLYLCGPGGLTQFSPDGKMLARFRVGLELPAAPLVGMAVGRLSNASGSELYIATRGAGVLAFGETSSRQILPDAAAARQLTSVLPLPTGRLLLGTEKSGVLVFDGAHLKSFQPQLTDTHVTALAGDDSNLWVGTINSGVIHWHAGQADHFAEAEGLPDPRVLSLLVEGQRTFAGTPLGVAEFHDGKFVRVLASGFFARSLLRDESELIVGTLDEGVVEVPLSGTGRPMARPRGQEIPGPVVRLLSADGNFYALTSGALLSFNPRGATWNSVLDPESAQLSDRDVSALNVDSSGRLWVGYFDRGLDVLDRGQQRVSHAEDDHVFCINRIIEDPRLKTTSVATANGLVVFDSALHERQVLGRDEGVIANQITDVALTPGGMTLATPAGLTFLTAGGARSIYAFQGLVNNHVYTLATAGSRLLAGTLGGVSILDGGHVKLNYTNANSGLNTNWITSLVRVGDDWFAGTYGGGIFELNAAGQWLTFPHATGPFVVNPNAMLVTDQRVYAGTLDRGLYVYDRAAQRWSSTLAGLPSPNVTALAVHDGMLYVGTDDGLIRIPEQDLAL
jgi:ligand-binding sensor domain-containing protein